VNDDGICRIAKNAEFQNRCPMQIMFCSEDPNMLIRSGMLKMLALFHKLCRNMKSTLKIVQYIEES